MSRPKAILLWLMAAAYILAGFNHLVNPDFYVNIMPPALPDPERLNVLAGLVEIVLGVYLLEPRTRVYAAWGIIALLIAVFPANLHVAMNNVDPSTGEAGAGAGALNWVRIPFQGLFIVWAWWYTRPDVQSGASSPRSARG